MTGKNELIGRGAEESPPLSPKEEYRSFSLAFFGHTELLRNMREQGIKAGAIPSEAENPFLLPEDIAKLKEKFADGDLFLESGNENRLLPMMKLDPTKKKLFLEVFEIGPMSPVAAREISVCLETMTEAVRYINGSPDRMEKYSRIYAFIDCLTRYIKGDIRAEDGGKIREFLESAEIILPCTLCDQSYKQSFHLPRIQSLLKFLFMNEEIPFNEDGFRHWLDTFKPPVRGKADLHLRIREIADGRLRDLFIRRFFRELNSPLPVFTRAGSAREEAVIQTGAGQSAPGNIAGPFRTTPSYIPPADLPAGPPPGHSMHPLPLLKRAADPDAIRDEAASKAAGIRAAGIRAAGGASGGEAFSTQNPVESARIIEVLEPMEALAAGLFNCMDEQRRQGADFTGAHMLIMCDFLFDETMLWVDKGKIMWRAVDNTGLISAFNKHPDPARGEKDLILHLHKLKMALAGKGYLGTPRDIALARAKFVLAIRARNKKKGIAP